MNRRPFAEGVFLELRGNHRLMAEGIETLLEYGETRIVVGAGTQRIALEGEQLEMKFLSVDRIVIEGTIRVIRYES